MTTDSQPIFISHATADDPHADKLVQLLRDGGLTVWIDHEHLQIGAPSWDKAIREAIRACACGIFIMTPQSLKSEVCEGECQLVRQLGKKLYVIYYQPCDPADIWFTIKQIQYADYVKHGDDAITRLIRAIGGDTAPDLPTSTKKFTDAGNIHDKLPYLQNPMRGREALLAEVRADISPTHITQVIGPGGLGKSRLVAEIALNDPNGAVWFRCERSKTLGDLNIALRQHAGLPEGTDSEIVLARIKSQNALVVVDNAEAVSDSQRADYVTLLQKIRGAGIRLVMTTRKSWQDLKNSTFHNIGGMDGPEGEQIIRDFATSESLTLTDAQLKELARESRYYPRLMEFNITQLREFEYDVVMKRLKKLRYEAHEDWQDALNEMITITVDQMKAERNEKSKTPEKRGVHADALLRRLTWLSAPCEKAVIIALKPADMTEDDVDDALALIRRYQFIRYDDQTKKYAVAELVREALGTDPTAFPIFANWYIGRARAIFDDLQDNPELWGDGEGGVNFDDVENIKGLGDDLRYLTQDGTTGDLEQALEFAVMTRRYVTDRMEAGAWAWLEMGLNAVRLLRRDEPDDTTLLSKESLMLGELGTIKQYLGHPHDAIRLYDEALPLYQKLGNNRGEATTLNNMGGVYSALGDKQKALTYYEQALPLRRAVGDKGGEATTLNNIGIVYSALGDKHKALVYYEQALPILRAVGDKRVEATTLNNIGRVYDALGDKQVALTYYEQVLPLYRAVGDRGGEAGALNNIGAVYSALGDKQKALAYYEQALTLYRVVGNRGGEAVTCFNIGMVYELLGDLDKAIEYAERAIQTTYPQDLNLKVFNDNLLRLKQQRGG